MIFNLLRRGSGTFIFEHVKSRPRLLIYKHHMPMRLAFALAALFLALTGVKEAMPRDPFEFGTTTIAENDRPLVEIWRQERKRLFIDIETVAACMRDGVPDCAAAFELMRIVAEAKAYEGKAQVAHINRAINLLIRPSPSVWLGALAVLRLGNGDCKDYAIAKYFALRQAGLSQNLLRLVIVRNRRLHEDHMIVAAYADHEWLILDNVTMVIATDADDLARYTPLFVLDETGVRGYVAIGS